MGGMGDIGDMGAMDGIVGMGGMENMGSMGGMGATGGMGIMDDMGSIDAMGGMGAMDGCAVGNWWAPYPYIYGMFVVFLSRVLFCLYLNCFTFLLLSLTLEYSDSHLVVCPSESCSDSFDS